MKTHINKILAAALVFAACGSVRAAVFDFSGATPVYDSNRAEVAGSGYYYYSELTSTATVGFNWSNSNYGVWFYAWNGINVSTSSNTTDIISGYYNAGNLASYTSVTATDGSGVSGGSYGIWYGSVVGGDSGYSESDAGTIMFNSLVDISSVQIANTRVTENYLNTTPPIVGDTFLFQVLVYGITFDSELTDNYVTVTLSSSDIGVTDTWLTADLSALNVDGGLYGLYFKTYTDDFGEWGANSPSYFALDNIVYTSVPEPAQFAAAFAVIALAFAAYRRRRK